MLSVAEYLNKKGYQYKVEKRPSGPNAIMICPYCNDKDNTFAINLNHGAFQCYRKNNCGVSGSFYQFQIDQGDEPETTKTYNYQKKKKPNYVKPKKAYNPPNSNTIKYLMSRGLTIETIKKYRIGEEKNGVYFFPYYKDGVVVDVKYRETGSKKMWREKNAEPVLFLRDFAKNCKEIIITEGEFDALVWRQMGFNAVSVPSGVDDLRWIENEWDFLDSYEKIYLNFDNDEAGKMNLRKIAVRLGEWRCYNIELTKKDANECLISGADRDYFECAVESAEEYNIDELVNAHYYKQDVIDLFLNKNKIVGDSTGISGLDNIMQGLREGEVTVWTGRNSSGKSTLLNQIMLNLGYLGYGICFGSFEMPPARVLRWMVLQNSKYTMQTEESVSSTMDEISEFLYLVNVEGMVDKKILFNTFEFGARKYGLKHFFIDSMMRIKFYAQNRNAEETNFMSELVAFARKHSAHIHIIAHPRKERYEKKIVSKTDVAGTGNITNLAHNVISISRIPENVKAKALEKGLRSPDSILSVIKNREHGTEGDVLLKFNSNTKLFTEFIK